MTDNTIKNSTYNVKNGRYVLGGQTEVSASFLEHWDRWEIPLSVDDIIYVMEKKYEGRPDMLGVLFYGDPGLWWTVCTYNGIINPFEELIEGKVLRVPLKERLMSVINKKLAIGGVISTRGNS